MSFQRAEDYYSEGELIWLDVDTKIRELSGDRHSLDDWARSFFGVQNGSHQSLGYTFYDVVASLKRASLPDSPYLSATLMIKEVVLVDEMTVDLFLTGPYPVLLNDIAGVSILNEKWIFFYLSGLLN